MAPRRLDSARHPETAPRAIARGPSPRPQSCRHGPRRAVQRAGGPGARACQPPALRGGPGALPTRARAPPQILMRLLARRRRRPRSLRGRDAAPLRRACPDPRRHAGARPRLRLGLLLPLARRALPACAGAWRLELETPARFHPGARAPPRPREPRDRNGRRQLLRTRGAFRPRRVRRDVRAHAQLAGAAGADRALARARRQALRARLLPPQRDLRVRRPRPRRLDGAALLQRRDDAVPAISCRASRAASSLEKRWRVRENTTGAPARPGSRGSTRSASRCAPRSSAATGPPRPSSGCSAGACSSSRAPSSSASARAKSGSSRTTGSREGRTHGRERRAPHWNRAGRAPKRAAGLCRDRTRRHRTGRAAP